MSCTVTLNDAKNGIEVRFEEKPDRAILDTLKENGFRWSRGQNMWFAKQSEERLALVKSFDTSTTKTEEVKKDSVLDLFTLTRVDRISEHKEESLSCKEIAALIRKHFRTTFPMFKFSVTSDFDSISAHITGSPYAKDSEEVEAMLNYMGEYIESWKPNSRYSFYGGRRYPSVDYDCQFREMTVSELNISELFKVRKAEFEEEERIRREIEYQQYLKEQEEKEKAYAIAEAKRNEEIALVESKAKVEECEQFFILKVLFNHSKLNTVEEYKSLDKEREYRKTCAVSRKVFLDKETYEMFTNNLLCDWTFIAGTGGSDTDDIRIKSMADYNHMTEMERKTVDWYNCNCVAIYCDNELKLVVDAQGYSYCRYVGFVDEESEIGEYTAPQSITEEEQDELKVKADTIEDVSTDIICKNEWKDTWETDNQLDYMAAMKEWMYANSFRLSKPIIQQIEVENLKHMMYRVLADMESIQEQFRVADIQPGQKVTIIRISDFGGLAIQKVIADSVEYGSYAQYDKAVKFIFKPERKRNLYYNWYYRDMMIVDGWVDVPENVLYDIDTSHPLFITKKSKFLSCDNAQYDVVSDYLLSKGITPIINMYNPSYRK